MKLLPAFLSPLLLAGLLCAEPARSPRSTAATRTTGCEQQWQAMARLHRQQAEAILKQNAGLRALLTMLRNDAGIVRDSTVRDGLQVSADMWESLLAGLQRQASSLQELAGQEDSQRQVLCASR